MTFDQETPRVPAGWFADPGRPGRLRWWDGDAWTERVGEPEAAVREPLGLDDWSLWQGGADPYVEDDQARATADERPVRARERRERRVGTRLVIVGAAVAAVGAVVLAVRLLAPVDETVGELRDTLPAPQADVTVLDTEDIARALTAEGLADHLSLDLEDEGLFVDDLTCQPFTAPEVGATTTCTAMFDEVALTLLVQVVDASAGGPPYGIVDRSISARLSS